MLILFIVKPIIRIKMNVEMTLMGIARALIKVIRKFLKKETR